MRRRMGMAALLAAAACSSGCGTGHYEELLQRRASTIGQLALFNEKLYDATQVAGTPVKLRVPKVFKQSFVATVNDPETGQPVDPRRLQPPFITLPGFQICYEASAAAPDKTKLHYYCYVATPTSAEIPIGSSLAETIRSQVGSKFPGAAWEDVSCPSPTGQPVACRRLTVSGPQDFYTGGGQYTTVNGKFQIYLHESQGQYVLVGWRVPDSIAPTANLDQLGMLTAGTITVNPPAPG